MFYSALQRGGPRWKVEQQATTAPPRAQEEHTQIKQKEEELEVLEKKLEQSQNLCLELEDDVLKNLKYEEFLELVKEICGPDKHVMY